jgi:hypothetical protein
MPVIKKDYELYFINKISDQAKNLAPHICCSACALDLRAWLNGKRQAMPFAMPIVWRELKDHISDCNFCLTDVSRHTSIKY